MNRTGFHDVIIVGAGFAGLYAVHRLRGQGLDVLCIEAAPEVTSFDQIAHIITVLGYRLVVADPQAGPQAAGEEPPAW